jgi:hypothetical protein
MPPNKRQMQFSKFNGINHSSKLESNALDSFQTFQKVSEVPCDVEFHDPLSTCPILKRAIHTEHRIDTNEDYEFDDQVLPCLTTPSCGSIVCSNLNRLAGPTVKRLMNNKSHCSNPSAMYSCNYLLYKVVEQVVVEELFGGDVNPTRLTSYTEEEC